MLCSSTRAEIIQPPSANCNHRNSGYSWGFHCLWKRMSFNLEETRARAPRWLPDLLRQLLHIALEAEWNMAETDTKHSVPQVRRRPCPSPCPFPSAMLDSDRKQTGDFISVSTSRPTARVHAAATSPGPASWIWSRGRQPKNNLRTHHPDARFYVCLWEEMKTPQGCVCIIHANNCWEAVAGAITVRALDGEGRADL